MIKQRTTVVRDCTTDCYDEKGDDQIHFFAIFSYIGDEICLTYNKGGLHLIFRFKTD